MNLNFSVKFWLLLVYAVKSKFGIVPNLRANRDVTGTWASSGRNIEVTNPNWFAERMSSHIIIILTILFMTAASAIMDLKFVWQQNESVLSISSIIS